MNLLLGSESFVAKNLNCDIKISRENCDLTNYDQLVNVLKKAPNLNKTVIAAILNDIILAMGLNRTQVTMYMNMIKQSRTKYQF